MTKPQLHASAISQGGNCMELFRLVQIEGLRSIPGRQAARGSGAHGGIDKDLSNKLETGELLPLEAVQDFTRDATVAAWERDGVRLNDEDKEKGAALVKAETIDAAIRLATLHHNVLAPTIEPLHVERPWVLELTGFDYDLAGRIDIQGVDKGIRDTKTKDKAPPKGLADTMLQLTVYSLAVRVLDGVDPTLTVDYLIDTKTPRTDQQTTTRNIKDYELLFRRIEMMSRAIERGVFLPAPDGAWWCSRAWCGFYRNGCSYYK